VASNPETSPTFSFQLSRDEYSSLLRRGNLSTARLRIFLLFFFAMTVVGFILRTTSAKDVGRPLFGLGLSFLIVFAIFIVYLGPSMTWKRDPTLAEPQSVTVATQGMTVTTSDRTMTLDWQRLSSAIELQKGFTFVFTGPPTIVLLPKRVIVSNQDLNFIRGFVPKPFIRIARI
jgi:hypothetical protein